MIVSSLPSLALSQTFVECSKWAKIARKKGANDENKAVVFSKMSVAISAAVRAGGADIASNLRLAAVVEKAKESNVPKDVIERAIAAGANTTGVEDVVLEGMGPGGTAILVETLTSNRKRTTISVRYIFNQHECEVGSTVAFMFDSRGRIVVPCKAEEQEKILELASALDAQDVSFIDDEDEAIIWTDPGIVQSVRKKLVEEHGVKPKSTDVIRFPKSTVDIPEDAEEQFGAFIADLEDHDDVQAVYHNASG
jgi:YebC/PmpR family DNA-binding regulatory protein